MLVLARSALDAMVAHCLDGSPLEACGLLTGPAPTDPDVAEATASVPATNDAASARVYTVAPIDLLRADRAASASGGEVLGVYHSHTHTDPLPSPTDVAQAPDPAWHYVLVSLRDIEPSVRSFRILDGKIVEETVVLQ